MTEAKQWPSKNAHIEILGYFQHVNLYHKRKFANVIKRSWDREIILDYLGGCNHKGSYKSEPGAVKTEKGDMVSELEVVVMYFQDERRGHKLANTGELQKLENAKKQILPEGSRMTIALTILWF